ncbi:hypothetical protein Ddye_021366 [Dipteronia dyeriana]|uniref:Uncharacterized protein n=1 Tax=Dipteronia dyeriana TaxID=168575 RepID=A0AAD9WWU1_9ROSI|nr:hypothetical protein Ddye_021366 [Dipteronia dyeriana]
MHEDEIEADREVMVPDRNVKKRKGTSSSKPNIRKWKRVATVMFELKENGNRCGILKVDEKLRGFEKSMMGLCNFRSVVDECDLLYLGFVGPKMTWNNKSDGYTNVHERIDRLLADCSWIDLFPEAKVKHLGFNSSDLRPLSLDFEEGFRGNDGNMGKSFKFEPF